MTEEAQQADEDWVPLGRIRLNERQAHGAYGALYAQQRVTVDAMKQAHKNGDEELAQVLKIHARTIEQVRRKIGQLTDEMGWQSPVGWKSSA